MEILCDISLFGGLRVVGRGSEGPAAKESPTLNRTRPRNADVLLARLACIRGHAAPREELADMLWPESRSSAQGLQRLSVELNRLRETLQALDISPDAVVSADRDRIALITSAVAVDVIRFEEACRQAGSGRGAAERLPLLIEAADLYHGSLLPGFDHAWVVSAREHFAGLYLDTVDAAVALLVESRDRDRAAAIATQAANLEPYREEAHRLVIRLLIEAGQPEAALRRYAALERHLEAVGEEPSEAARRLATEALARPPRSETPSPVAESESPPEVASPVVPLRRAPSLPSYFYRFIGRDADREHLTELLLSPEVRLVTLTGPGGCGKTRLAVETTQRVAPAFAGSAWFVSLTEVTDARLIAEHIVRTVGGSALSGRDPLDRIEEYFADQPALLVLDNFEQLVTAGRSVIRTLLERTPALKCLVTSRQRLGLTAEREWELMPLPTPGSAAWSSSARIGECPSVQLFVDQARRRRSDFQLNAKNAAAVAALCDRLDGLPLAIELAAAWAKMLTPPQMLARVDEILVSRDEDRPEQHRSLTAALDVSYRLLDADLRSFLESLSVFPGSWSLEAAESICAEGGELSALDALERLRAASLIVADEQRSGEIRFRMLETLRAYAMVRLHNSGRQAALQTRHHEFYLARAQEAIEGLQGWDQAAWLDYLETEHANLHVALANSDLETRVRTAAGLRRFWEIRGHLSEGRHYLAAALDPGTPLSLDTRRAALLAGGLLELDVCEYAAAQRFFEEGDAICYSQPEKAAFLLGKAGPLLMLGQEEAAVVVAQDALDRAESFYGSEATALAEYHNMLGLVFKIRGDRDRAHEQYKRALFLAAQDAGRDPSLTAKYHSNMGSLLEERGELREALICLLKALRIGRRVFGRRHPSGAIRHNSIGRICAKTGRWGRALRHHTRAIAIFRQTYAHPHIDIGMSLYYVATALRGLGREREGLEQLREALPILERHFGSDHARVREVREAVRMPVQERKETSAGAGK